MRIIILFVIIVAIVVLLALNSTAPAPSPDDAHKTAPAASNEIVREPPASVAGESIAEVLANDKPLPGVLLSWNGGSATTDAAGYARLPRLPVGTKISASRKGYISGEHIRSDNDHVSFSLSELKIEIEAIDLLTGEPCKNISVTLDGKSLTIVDGVAALPDFAPGSSNLVATKPGYLPRTMMVDLAGQLPAASIVLQPLVVSGVITEGTEGVPVKDAVVSLFGRSIATNEHGEFRFSGLPELEQMKKKGEVRVKKDGYRDGLALFGLTDGNALVDIVIIKE